MNQDEQLEVRGARKRRAFHMAAGPTTDKDRVKKR